MTSKTLALISVGISLTVAPAVAADAAATDKPATKYAPPRTPDGHPDFSGVWSNASTIPLERPKNLGTREFYSEEEAAAIDARAKTPRPVAEQGAGEAHYDMTQFGL